MIRTDRAFSEAVTRAVQQAERGTSAELIVVIAARSGSYLDSALMSGAVAATAALLVALFAPASFHPAAVAVEVPLVFAAAAWLAHRSPALLRRITPAERMRGQVERAATAHFVSEAMHGTRARTGLLVYLSRLEQRVALVPDLGLEARIPRAAWSEILWCARGDPSRPRTPSDFVGGLTQIGAILRARMPGGDADGNEAADEPRFVP